VHLVDITDGRKTEQHLCAEHGAHEVTPLTASHDKGDAQLRIALAFAIGLAGGLFIQNLLVTWWTAGHFGVWLAQLLLFVCIIASIWLERRRRVAAKSYRPR